MTGTAKVIVKLLFLLVILAAPTSAVAAGKVALVIGNGGYKAMSSLKNPPNDANLMANKLGSLGFEVVRIIDGDRRAFYDGLTRFGRMALGADVALVFYAGHGVQVNGRNWLLPVDAEIEAATDLPAQALKANDLLDIMEASGARLKLVFFDACRNNPLPRSMSRGTSNGLARLEANAAGMMIAFATSPGDVALDGTGNNSPFTEALARLIDTPDLEVRHLMGKVRESVYKSTRERQLPWLNEALIGEFYFGGKLQDSADWGDSSDSSASTESSTEPDEKVAAVDEGEYTPPAAALTKTRHQSAPAYARDLCTRSATAGGTFEFCASSVLDPQYGNRYGPGNLVDGKLTTAWVEGVSGNGNGERILINFDRPRLLSGFEIVNGYAKNKDIFFKNARVNTAILRLSDGSSETISLPDNMRTSRFDFSQPVETSWIEIEIATVFKGKKYADTALSEFLPIFAD
ncbi:MAG: caspase family protein [Roseibium sp.]|nr:caspase family protein [Roseibium sp.]